MNSGQFANAQDYCIAWGTYRAAEISTLPLAEEWILTCSFSVTLYSLNVLNFYQLCNAFLQHGAKMKIMKQINGFQSRAVRYSITCHKMKPLIFFFSPPLYSFSREHFDRHKLVGVFFYWDFVFYVHMWLLGFVPLFHFGIFVGKLP